MKSKIKRRKFGNTGLYVSELSFGSMNLRLLDSPEQAYELLDYVLDQGINLIDTAREYCKMNKDGYLMESEYFVGQAIEKRTGLDEPIVIVTKGHGYTLPELDADLGTSLEKLKIRGKGNLKIGKNDIKLVYFLHGINEARWESIKNSGVLDKLKELKSEGVINYIGFSSHYRNVKEIREAADTGIFEVAELPYNVFNRSLGEDGQINFLKYFNDKGIALINMKAFGGNGMVPVMKILRDYVDIDYSVMLNFCLSNPYISTVDAGARYIHEFEADINTALAPRFDDSQLMKLKQEADKVSGLFQNICRECMHCLEKFSCPQEIDFPGILSVYSRYNVNEKLGRNTSEFFEQYRKFELNAENCLECGECSKWCEYGLNIPVMLREAHNILK
jgi:predicted aldo/keto reductase-like oxidoreductase